MIVVKKKKLYVKSLLGFWSELVLKLIKSIWILIQLIRFFLKKKKMIIIYYNSFKNDFFIINLLIINFSLKKKKKKLDLYFKGSPIK